MSVQYLDGNKQSEAAKIHNSAENRQTSERSAFCILTLTLHLVLLPHNFISPSLVSSTN